MLKMQSDEKNLTVFLTGELDHHKCSEIRKQIDARAEQERPALLKLDFEDVRFMDSSGVGLVMGRYRQMSLLGGRLQVVNVPENISRVFRLSGLERLGVM
ncbi:MAG: anti-sigma factor antagonist [Ruminococcus sp.]|nr:anti-sigma factor antagonist [Ruminococcus sp.]